MKSDKYDISLKSVYGEPASLVRRYPFGASATLITFLLISSGIFIVSLALPGPSAIVFNTAIILAVLALQVRRLGVELSGPLLLFTLTMFVFVWARPLIAFSSNIFNLSYIAVLSGIQVSNLELKIYYSSIVASMVGFSSTILALQFSANKRRHLAGSRSFSSRYLQAWRITFWLGAASSLVQTIFYVRYYLNGGTYYQLYVQGHSSVGIPGLSLISSLMFYGYVGLLLTTRKSGEISTTNRRKIWSGVFVVLTLLDVTHGARGGAFTQLLVGIWLKSFTASDRIRIRTWLISCTGLFLVSQAVSSIRSGSMDLFDSKTILKIVEWFLYVQGLSGELVAPASRLFGVKLENIRFVLFPLLAPVRKILDPSFGQQTVQAGQSSGLLAQELAYRIAPQYFLAGHGAGSSYIAETYCAFGIVGVFLATALLVWIVSRGPSLVSRSYIGLFVFSTCLPFILFVPRESLVFCVVPALKALLVLFGVLKLRKALCLLR